MCFPVCLFWNLVIHFSRSSPSFQCFFILWLRFFFIHPPTPVFLHPSILSLVSFLCFSILWLLCFFLHSSTPSSRSCVSPSSGSSVISSILQLLCFFIHPLAPCLSSFSSRSSVLRRACSEELRLLLVFGSVECLASEL